MRRSSFTARLMLAMMLTVVMVTAGVLWLMRQRVETSYLRLFEERFRSQIEMFASLQTVRLESIRQRCRMLAASAAVVEALQLGSGELPDAMLQDLQASATTFDERAQAAAGRLPVHKTQPAGTVTIAGTALRRREYRPETPDFVDLALVSSLGQVYSLKSGSAPGKNLRWLEDDRISRVPAEQQTGYVLTEKASDGFRQPREVILTPVQDPQSSEILGALAVGLPLTGYGEDVLYDLNRPGKPGTISTGLWLENHIFTSSIPAADQPALKEQLQAAIQQARAGQPEGTISVKVRLSGRDYQMMLRPLSSDSALPMAWGIMLSSLAGMEKEQQALRNEVLGAAGLGLGVALLLSFFLSRNLMSPVRSLVHGTREIRGGNYAARVRISRRDELGLLGESFNEMAGGLEQREQYHSILIQLSDYHVAQRLIASPSLGGERREVSVLFCDIRGFTGVTAGMEPEDVISMLNEHMTALTACVHRYHGVVDKFVGDLIMAVFGAPESAGDDAGNAARCGMAMMETRRQLNRVTSHPVLEVGIGIASGLCIAGCMGSENRLNYTVLGQRVNLASRLCSAAAPGQILLDGTTAGRLGPAFLMERQEERLFKGFDCPVISFSLKGQAGELSPETGSLAASELA